MTTDGSTEARFEASEAQIEKRLQELFSEFKRSLLDSPNKSQHGKSSNLNGSRSEKYVQGQDAGYPHMRVEFPRWEDGDLTS
ncbi:hypothetical protein B296_00031599 [Ensete ventricosum]|uniref:Uncharacterized protein n=1 Tax=Ensete ventricosum TaxID=4639 RepID=A0A426YBT7_ENSVE|nr:hypothetical protein B296_00031599 [Ensete ventricosum]